MKKVIFLTPHFLPHLGGVETHVSEVARVLTGRLWEIEIVTVQETDSQPLIERFEFGQVTRIPLAAQSSKKQMWNWFKKYFKSVDKDAIVHIHDVGWWIIPQLLLGNKKRFYITFHGWEGIYPVRWQAKLHRLFISRLVNKSIHVGSFISEFYWDKPNKVVYGGVKLPVQTAIAHPQLPALNITFLGRLEKENCLELFLKLLTELTEEKLKINITWVGDGHYRSICEKWGKVTGMVSNVRKYITNADVVFSSSYLSMLEAEAQGKIVCALYDNPLKKRYLETFPGQAGLLIDDAAEKLVPRVLGLLKNDHRFAQISKQNAAFAQSQTWNKVADIYEELWGIV